MISVIIPVFNEEKLLPRCLNALTNSEKAENFEVIVVDGGSTDATLSIAENLGIKCLLSPKRGRAAQMNHGAKCASGNILFFLHADAEVPQNFADHIQKTLKEFDFGYFAYEFTPSSYLLSIMTQFNKYQGFFSGGGDQGFFLSKDLFDQVGGFRDDYPIMEDFEIKKRLLGLNFNYQIVRGARLKVSSRKYDTNSFIRVWYANTIAFVMFELGLDINRIKRFYQKQLE